MSMPAAEKYAHLAHSDNLEYLGLQYGICH